MKTSRRNFLAGASALALMLLADTAEAWTHGQGTTQVTWNNVAFNGGGSFMGFSISADGTKLCRTDIAGAFKWDGSKWNQILNENHLPWPTFGGYRALNGVPDIQIAYSNSSIIYALIFDSYANDRINGGSGFIFKSTDGGATFAQTNYPMSSSPVGVDGDPVLFGQSPSYKRIKNKIAIDPANPNVCYACNPSKNPLVTFDGWTTSANVPNLPITGYIGAVCWMFDPSNGTTTVNGQTVTKYIYVAVEDSGVWQSTNGGVSFSLVGAFPGVGCLPQYCDISSDGAYYVTYSGTAAGGYGCILSRYQGSTWTTGLFTVANGLPRDGSLLSIAAHPTSAGVLVGMYVLNASPHFKYSSNYGSPFSTNINKSAELLVSSGAGWLAAQLQGASLTNAGILFDPNTPNDLYICYGQGVVKMSLTAGSPPTFPAAPTLTTFTLGVENAVCNDLQHEIGTPLLQVMADIIGAYRSTSTLGTAPAALLNPANIGDPFVRASAWAGAIDPFNTNNAVICADSNLNLSANPLYGYTQNGGSTWHGFAPGAGPKAATNGATAAGNNVLHFASVPTDAAGGSLVYNLTNPSSIPANTYVSSKTGATVTLTHNAAGAGIASGDTIAFCQVADTVPSNIMIGNGVVLWMPYRNWYRSTDFGATGWTQCVTPGVASGDGWGGNFSSVPSQTGCVDRTDPNTFYIYNSTLGNIPDTKGIWRSTDAGANFTYLGSPSDPFNRNVLAYLKCVPGLHQYLFASTGYISGATHPVVDGKFVKSTDGGSTWTQIPNMLEVNFGFGKAGPSGNPTLFVAGFYKGNQGIYMSTDLGTSWIQLTSTQYGIWPATNDAVQCVEGDKDVFGRCYIGFRGSGAVYSTLV